LAEKPVASGYIVDRVVICDAYREPDRHYQLLPGGKSKLTQGRRPSMRFRATAKDTKGGIDGIIGKEAALFEEMTAAAEEKNEAVIQLRDEVRAWREAGYPGTSLVTRRCLEWWFERDEERFKQGKRFFFCQQEAIEALIYLYEVQRQRKMLETGDFIRYALKLATGTGKTLVMALIVVWSTLHKQKVSGSPLSKNFLVLVPNLTVRDRVRGVDQLTNQPTGSGVDPRSPENLYDEFEIVPPEYFSEFHPNVEVRNWQGIPLEAKRDDWIAENEIAQEGRFVPASVLWALQRRRKQDPSRAMRRVLGGWRDLVVINDEAHHVYGEKRKRKGEDPEYIKWSKILDRIRGAAKISVVVDLSATPWYGSGSPKPEGTLFEWLVSDFSVYDAFESGLVKVVRLPDPEAEGRQYLDLWDGVKGARSKEEYLSACKGAIASIYSSWSEDYNEWESTFPELRPGPSPVLLVVADRAERAQWLFEHLSRDYPALQNASEEDPLKLVTIRIDSKVFDAEKGNEAILREMVNTVGKKGKAGEHVRCIVSVNMLSEGWDVKSVTHILGLRAFGSPLLTEQIIGRGLRRTSYDGLLIPIEERLKNENRPDEETVDAFGIPFIGFPVEKRRRPKTGTWGQKPVPIEADPKKEKFAIRVPNLRSWAVGVTRPLHEAININGLPGLKITSKETPAEVRVRPVVGGAPEAVMTLERFRAEYPLLRSKFIFARELFEATNPGTASDLGIGPTFEELLEFATEYVEHKVTVEGGSDSRDIGIYYWTRRALNILETAIREVAVGTSSVPILGKPNYLDSRDYRRRTWTGITAEGKKCHLSKVPCHTNLEATLAGYLDRASDVIRYLKNEFFGFSVTYYENTRPRQYFPDFIVLVKDAQGREIWWLVETKGEIRANTELKREAANLWCERMTAAGQGTWRHLFLQQRKFERAVASSIKTFHELAESLVQEKKEPQLQLVDLGDSRLTTERFKSLLPVYSLKAAAGYFGKGETVEPAGWIEAESIGKLDESMFVTKVVGRSMEPRIYDGDFCVFRAKPVGSRQGKIVLVQYRGTADPDTGGSFTVKRYSSEKSVDGEESWRHKKIILSPLNPDFQPIVLAPESEDDVQVIAEWITVLGKV
jgi:type III restriction enzyme